ncbi:unnamed protein product [Prunus brigantina]
MTEGMGWVRKWTVVMRYKLKICCSTRISMASDVDGTARGQCTARSSEGYLNRGGDLQGVYSNAFSGRSISVCGQKKFL